MAALDHGSQYAADQKCYYISHVCILDTAIAKHFKHLTFKQTLTVR